MKANTETWHSLLLGCILMLGSGTSYLFPLYGPTLRNLFQFSQTQINTIYSCQKFGGNFSILAGAVNDRYGPAYTALFATFSSGLAYLFVWMAGRGQISNSFFFICVLFYCEGSGASALYFSAFSCVTRFPLKNRGMVIGTLLSFVGLAAAIWTQVYRIVFSPDVVAFLGFMSAAVSCLGLLGYVTTPKPEKIVKGDNSKRELRVTVDIAPSQLMKTADFWILCSIMFILCGCGSCIIVNLGSMVISVGGFPGEQNILVFYLSIANCAGRLASFLVILSISMMFSQLFFVIMPDHSYYWLGIIAVGISYGGIYTLIPNIIMSLFGQKHFGKNYSIAGAFPALGSLVIGSILAGQVYDIYADENGYCVGFQCYQTTLLCNCVLCFIAMILSFLLTKKMKQPVILIHI